MGHNRFRDKVGREWALAIDVIAMEAVHQRTGVKIWDLLKNELAELRALQSNPVTLVRVLYVLCEGQATQLGVSPEQFGRALDGDALVAGHDALIEAYADFSPSRLRPLIRDLTAKSITDRMPSDSATSSPASAESTPAG
ncbi:hypothetical protein R5W24_004444 [Gemmata sp. JC717]|uniref:hypothetical protein n=1 Tax=Gemmata algarum TaxID=2975278 RepID=UPI0021BA51FE|nr:hypothetical protein [Gemmata algarum]MDY3555303.1 hypothetical protein [Gemmata algarum]